MGLLYDQKIVDRFKLNLPLLERGRFLVKLAATEEELARILELRHRVFRVERDCGPEKSDRDQFDDYAFHIMVVDQESDQVVGTYRAIFGEFAKTRGFYTSQEYQLDPIFQYPVDEICEIGRSCVLSEWRRGPSIMLLWTGLAELKKRNNYNYLLGCASIDTVNPAVAYAFYRRFKEMGLHNRDWQLQPQSKYFLPEPPEADIEAASQQIADKTPPLIKGYLRLGAKISGPPILDLDFGCADLPIWFDFVDIDQKYDRHFLQGEEPK